MERPKKKRFLGTYFNKDAVMKLATVAKVFAWIIAAIYLFQWVLQIYIYVQQSLLGYWIGLRFTDIAQNIFWIFEQPLRGLVYFVVLHGVAQVLLMLMDIEDNTRRTAEGHDLSTK